MESAWRWLMRANARGVLGSALGVLLLVGAWWGWREIAPPRRESAGKRRGVSARHQAGLGLTELLENELSARYAVIRGNPFLMERPHRPPKPPPTVATDKPPAKAEPAVAPPPAPQPPPPPPPPPARATIALTYRGLVRRSDGQTSALVRNEKSGTTSFLRPGRDFFGYRIHEMSEGSLQMVRSDGSLGVELPLNARTELEILSDEHAKPKTD